MKVAPLLATLDTVTTTFPVVAPLGTGATILVALQLVGVAVVPLNVTVLVLCVEPKFVPVIVTDAPTPPDVGERLEMVGPTPSTGVAQTRGRNRNASRTVDFQQRAGIQTSSRFSAEATLTSGQVTHGPPSADLITKK